MDPQADYSLVMKMFVLYGEWFALERILNLSAFSWARRFEHMNPFRGLEGSRTLGRRRRRN